MPESTLTQLTIYEIITYAHGVKASKFFTKSFTVGVKILSLYLMSAPGRNFKAQCTVPNLPLKTASWKTISGTSSLRKKRAVLALFLLAIQPVP